MPSILPAYTKTLRYGAAFEAYWDTQTYLSGTVRGVAALNAVYCRKASLVFARTEPTGAPDDVMLFSLHFVKDDGAGVLTAWTDPGDYTTLETAFATWWTSQKVHHPPHVTFQEVRWHRFGVDQPVGTSGALKEGPVERVHAVAVAGTYGGTSLVPDQVAQSVTFKSPSRKHWGRVYFPIPAGALSAEGRFGTAAVDDAATFLHTALATAEAANLHPVTWSAQHGGALAILSLQVDDVPDVIRRRRAKHRTYVKEFVT